MIGTGDLKDILKEVLHEIKGLRSDINKGLQGVDLRLAEIEEQNDARFEARHAALAAELKKKRSHRHHH